MEKELRTIQGYVAVPINLLLLALALYFFSTQGLATLGVMGLAASILMLRGYFTVLPQEAKICSVFGTYRGTVKQPGFYWYNPFVQRQLISLKKSSIKSSEWTVHDCQELPLQVSVNIRWSIISPADAFFNVQNASEFVVSKSESILQHLIANYQYQHGEKHLKDSLPHKLPQLNAAFHRSLNKALEVYGLRAEEAKISGMKADVVISENTYQEQLAQWLKSRHVLLEGGIQLTEKILKRLETKEWKLDEPAKNQLLNTVLASVSKMPIPNRENPF